MKKKVAGIIILLLGLFTAYSLVNGNMAAGIGSLVVLVLVGFLLRDKSGDSKEMINKVLKDKDQETYGHITEDGKLDFDQAKSAREEILKNRKSTDAVSDEINEAAGLMLNKDFAGSIRAYEHIMENNPDYKGMCLAQIGVAEYFLGNYEKAYEKYLESRSFGEDNDMTEDNIWEACETIYKTNNTKDYIEKYLSLYPNGRYIKKANKLIS